MYAEVVVLSYQAPDINFFTYKIPKNLEKEIKVGQLVEVPFGKRNPTGLVLRLFKERPRSITTRTHLENTLIKSINTITMDSPIILPYQVDLLRWMSEYYLAPMVNCAESLLPPLAKVQQRQVTRLILESSLEQTLILVPSINRIAETLAKFPKAKNYAIYTNELKPAEKLETWQKIQSGLVDFIFGSRSAIFTPAPNLKEIIIYDEHDTAYKDERSPYYDTLTVAQKISDLTGAQIKIVDPVPKITTYFALPNHIKMQKFPIKTHIISMEEDRAGGNKKPISEELADILRINQNKNILIFLNKKKDSGFIHCRNCKNKEFLENPPEFCPNCKSPDIFFNSLNISSLEKNIKAIAPNAKTNLIEKNKTGPTDATLDIATAAIFYNPPLKKYDIVANLSADSTLNRSDYTSGEKLMEQITNLKKLAKPNGKLVIQTYNPNDPTLINSTLGDFDQFAKLELEQRKLLLYPPFALFIKITIKEKNVEKAKKTADDIFNDLKDKSTQNSRLSISGLYESFGKRPKYSKKGSAYNIIVKHKLENFSVQSREKAVRQIANMFNFERKNVQITVEPQSIN